ncbi:MAG: MgtC/SapB family protein [Candidatus Tyrphobacter sp.]
MEPIGQGWMQIAELALAFVLSALIGLEREYRHKSAGLRTYTIVGFAAALLMLVSKYGFTDVLRAGHVIVDPSRVAAQIVTGIGFIGGGLIFVRAATVQGLTTAAVVWLTAAVGMACGAGLPILAAVVTAGHFAVVLGFPGLLARVRRGAPSEMTIELTYEEGHDVLRNVLERVVARGFTVTQMHGERNVEQRRGTAQVRLGLLGRGTPTQLVDQLASIGGVLATRWDEDENA